MVMTTLVASMMTTALALVMSDDDIGRDDNDVGAGDDVEADDAVINIESSYCHLMWGLMTLTMTTMHLSMTLGQISMISMNLCIII